mmetsp:Transcript_27868/g.39263  ORF Transcript_27868/g.39263 Transcript_27868/m.39263 type:complete len:599 (-) Transcript_27868:102-1898(-)
MSSRTSSNSNSTDSSPANTIRGGIPKDYLSEVYLDKLCDNIELLLDDIKVLDILCAKATGYEEFPALLYRFFFVHDKTHTLLRWALEKDINTLSPNELFRGETMATRLFYWQFFGDLGKRFLSSLLANLLKQFAELKYSIEIEASRSATPVDTEANLKWVLNQLNDFILQLQDSADHCPLGLRESFMFLKDVVGNKVENSSVFIASVLFLRLICPCLVLPEQYEILDSLGLKLTPHGKRGLIIASKILQSAANNSLWDHKEGSEKVNEFIKQANPMIVKFASKLIDADVISLGKKVMKASVQPASSTEIKQTHSSLVKFIAEQVLNKQQLQAEIDYQKKYELGMKYYRATEWKVGAEGPKTLECEYFVAQLKQPGSSVFVCKSQGRFKMKFELVRDYIRFTHPEIYLDDRIESFQILQQYDERHVDMHHAAGPMFPVSGRDWVYTRRNFDETPDRFVEVCYSVKRADFPPKKKYVRAEVDIVFLVVERDPTNPEFTLYTYIFDVDLKGWIPAFFINKVNKDNMSVLEKVAKGIMNLDKEPIQHISKKVMTDEQKAQKAKTEQKQKKVSKNSSDKNLQSDKSAETKAKKEKKPALHEQV